VYNTLLTIYFFQFPCLSLVLKKSKKFFLVVAARLLELSEGATLALKKYLFFWGKF